MIELERLRETARRIQEYLAANKELMTTNTARSTRAAGDAIEARISQAFPNLCAFELRDFAAGTSRKSTDDLSFRDERGGKYLVDVKTHRVDASFSMPNITSIPKVFQIHEDPQAYFLILFVRYRLNELEITCDEVILTPIEHLDWSCLRFGNIGEGQIQLKKATNLELNSRQTRKQWMLEMCELLLAFYPKEKKKLERRLLEAQKYRDLWKSRD